MIDRLLFPVAGPNIANPDEDCQSGLEAIARVRRQVVNWIRGVLSLVFESGKRKMNPTERFGDLTELINYHLGLHDGVELRDIYKLLHQSVFGPGHLGEGASESAIAEEMQSAEGVGFEEPLIEPVSIDATACRINLRPARRQGISALVIAEAMSLSAEKFACDRDEMARLWRDAGKSMDAFIKEFAMEDFEELTALAKKEGFPALHHSSSYREINRPAYRVLIGRKLERLMRGLPASGLSP